MQTCRNVNREWTLHMERHLWQRSMSLDDKTWSLPWWGTWDTAPHWNNASKWVFQFVYVIQCSISITTSTMCSIEERTNNVTMHSVKRINLWLGQWPNITYINKECCKVFNWEEDKAMVRTVTLMFQYHVSSTDTMCSIKESVPIDRAVAQYYLCI